MLKDSFKFYMPVNIVKGKDGEDKEMILDGIASTPHVDNQNEELDTTGLDYSYLANSGFVNWHHQLNKDPESIIGQPIECKLTKGGLYIKSKLYNTDMAKKAYKITQTLIKEGSNRRMGWSIEGKVVERDPVNQNKVLKARITGVALTPMPVNPNTFVNIVKAMNGEEIETYEEDETNGGAVVELEHTTKTGQVVKILNSGKIIIDTSKSMSTENSGAVIKEDLEGTPKRLTKAEVYNKIWEAHPEFSIQQVKRVYDSILKQKCD